MSGKIVNVAVIGAGVVGRSFLNQILSARLPIVFNLVYVSTSKKCLVSKDFSSLEVDVGSWEQQLNGSGEAVYSQSALLEFLKKSDYPVILVDNTSNEQIAKSYVDFVNSGISVATPNKKAFSSDLKTWNDLFAVADGRGLVYHEATVGAGLPILSTLREFINTGDQVEKIEGIFSGTLSYIFNEFATTTPNDVKFSDVVKVAKELGYTEPDPRDDLNGLDVARKVTIVARIAGLQIESPTSFPVQSLIPKPLESIKSADEFMQNLPKYDDELTALKKQATTENKVLRFIGKVDVLSNKVTVGIEKYDYSHPFASLKGSDNVISIKTKRYQNPLIIQGAGAGAEVTAAGIFGDVIKIAQRL